MLEFIFKILKSTKNTSEDKTQTEVLNQIIIELLPLNDIINLSLSNEVGLEVNLKAVYVVG